MPSALGDSRAPSTGWPRKVRSSQGSPRLLPVVLGRQPPSPYYLCILSREFMLFFLTTAIKFTFSTSPRQAALWILDRSLSRMLYPSRELRATFLFSRLRRLKPSLTELVTGRDDSSLKLKSFFIFLHFKNAWLFTTSTTQH